MTCILSVISQVKTVAVCGLVMLVFHTGVMSGAEVQPQKPGSNVIRVWSIGSPLTGALPQNTVPPALELQAKKLDYTIEVVNMRAIEFAPKLRQAVHKHNEPEILTFDNFFVLEGITTPAGRIEGVLSDQHIASSLVMVYETLVPLQPRGWVILVRSAPNYQAAQTLAMQPPVCPQEFTRARQSLTLAELRRAQETATNAARSYLTCDLSSLSAVSDRSRFGKECFLPDADREVESLEACAVTGNRNLALVSLAGSFRSKSRIPHIRDKDYAYWLTNKALGRQSIVAVLRNQDGVWRVVAITDDPFNTNRQGILTVLGFGDLLDDSPAGSVAPEPARLITREGARLRTPVGFADFFWRPSPGSEVVGEVAEFLVQTSSTRERTRLFFLTGNEGRLSSGRIWGLLGRWRVWSISRDGMVSFTEHRSYRN